jgi:hypothetical protein
MPLHIGSLEALRVARPKAVDLERINDSKNARVVSQRRPRFVWIALVPDRQPSLGICVDGARVISRRRWTDHCRLSLSISDSSGGAGSRPDRELRVRCEGDRLGQVPVPEDLRFVLGQ